MIQCCETNLCGGEHLCSQVVERRLSVASVAHRTKSKPADRRLKLDSACVGVQRNLSTCRIAVSEEYRVQSSQSFHNFDWLVGWLRFGGTFSTMYRAFENSSFVKTTFVES